LDAADLQALTQRYRQKLPAFVVQVPHDMPEHGLVAGQYAVNQKALLQELHYEVGLRLDARKQVAAAAKQAQEATKQVAQAAQRNAATLAAAKAKPTAANPKQTSDRRTAPGTKADWMAALVADDDE
jgi:hypothetical protein